MVLNLLVSVLCFWQAASFESGVSDTRAAQGSHPASLLVYEACTRGKAALETPPERFAGASQTVETKARKAAGLNLSHEGLAKPAAPMPGWQSAQAVAGYVSRGRSLLYPFHSFL